MDDLLLTIDTGLATCGWALTDAATGDCEAWDQTESDKGATFEERCAQHARGIIEAVEEVLTVRGARLHSVHLEVSGEGAPNSKRWGVLLVNAVTARLWHHLGEHWDWAVSIRPIHERERGVRKLNEVGIVLAAHDDLVGGGWEADETRLLKRDGSPNASRQHGADAILLGRAVRRRLELLELAGRPR